MTTADSGGMVLRGGPISPFVRKVGICILEKHLEQQVRRVRSLTVFTTPNTELQQLNPLSKIPTLIRADGTALFDSDVICEYLDALSPPATLFPPVGLARWQARRWSALGSGLLDVLVYWRAERNRPPELQSTQILQAFAIKMQAAMRLIETEMPLIDAAPFAIGHIAIGCALGYLDFRFQTLVDWRPGHPRCGEWFEQFMQRPSVRRTVPYEGTPPAASVPHLWADAPA